MSDYWFSIFKLANKRPNIFIQAGSNSFWVICCLLGFSLIFTLVFLFVYYCCLVYRQKSIQKKKIVAFSILTFGLFLIGWGSYFVFNPESALSIATANSTKYYADNSLVSKKINNELHFTKDSGFSAKPYLSSDGNVDIYYKSQLIATVKHGVYISGDTMGDLYYSMLQKLSNQGRLNDKYSIVSIDKRIVIVYEKNGYEYRMSGVASFDNLHNQITTERIE